MSSEVETLSFKIGLSGLYYGEKRPQYSIRLDGVEQVGGFITADSEETEYVEFSAEVAEGSHLLEVAFLNKEPGDTQVVDYDRNDPSVYTIVRDLTLSVESISVDEIDLGNLRFTHSRYVLDKPEIVGRDTFTEFTQCCNFGFNGRYQIEFNSPFYMWLLETM
jgi:hypothetical protein